MGHKIWIIKLVWIHFPKGFVNWGIFEIFHLFQKFFILAILLLYFIVNSLFCLCIVHDQIIIGLNHLDIIHLFGKLSHGVILAGAVDPVGSFLVLEDWVVGQINRLCFEPSSDIISCLKHHNTMPIFCKFWSSCHSGYSGTNHYGMDISLHLIMKRI